MKKLSVISIVLLTVVCFLSSFVVFGLFLYSRVSTVKGSGRVETQSRDLDAFKKVSINIPARVVVEEGSKEGVEIQADNNILDSIKTNISGNKLSISYKRDVAGLFAKNIKPSEVIDIKLTTTDLEEVKISGSATLTGENNYVLNTDKLKIDIDGSGKVDLEIKVKELEVDISGSGEVTFFGVTKEQDVDIDGSAKYLAIDLESEKAEINISGSARASIAAEEELSIDISGSGEVQYKGDPDKFNQDISGSGKVERVR